MVVLTSYIVDGLLIKLHIVLDALFPLGVHLLSNSNFPLENLVLPLKLLQLVQEGLLMFLFGCIFLCLLVQLLYLLGLLRRFFVEVCNVVLTLFQLLNSFLEGCLYLLSLLQKLLLFIDHLNDQLLCVAYL
jgi:hypothetical protein